MKVQKQSTYVYYSVGHRDVSYLANIIHANLPVRPGGKQSSADHLLNVYSFSYFFPPPNNKDWSGTRLGQVPHARLYVSRFLFFPFSLYFFLSYIFFFHIYFIYFSFYSICFISFYFCFSVFTRRLVGLSFFIFFPYLQKMQVHTRTIGSKLALALRHSFF